MKRLTLLALLVSAAPLAAQSSDTKLAAASYGISVASHVIADAVRGKNPFQSKSFAQTLRRSIVPATLQFAAVKTIAMQNAAIVKSGPGRCNDCTGWKPLPPPQFVPVRGPNFNPVCNDCTGWKPWPRPQFTP
jgi:hypothetical protein